MANGTKYDEGKLRMDLLPAESLESVVRVFMFGATVHGENNWQDVPDARRRYLSAIMRHALAIMKGKDMDDEGPGATGEPHAACIAANALFLIYFLNHPKKGRKPREVKDGGTGS